MPEHILGDRRDAGRVLADHRFLVRELGVPAQVELFHDVAGKEFVIQFGPRRWWRRCAPPGWSGRSASSTGRRPNGAAPTSGPRPAIQFDAVIHIGETRVVEPVRAGRGTGDLPNPFTL